MQRRILIVDEHLANREIHTDVRQSEAVQAQIETALGVSAATRLTMDNPEGRCR